ncbi:hypothetical protein ILUMI_04546 [Ignelater luminosus]|uniref:C2H2-type domain-containing protein n=1 Tax=Ignelater luminosus TaxID=2038154 RepID=A0A8K0DCC4_IGNLU|nr:hypothetical protein ILUMI_04546 [Ignelater luminosus]
MGDITLLEQNLQLPQTLITDNENDEACSTIQVIFPEGTPISPLISDLISFEDITNEIEQQSPKPKKSRKETLPFEEYWTPAGYECPNCDKLYNARKNLARHMNLECGKEPQFMCSYCDYKNHRRNEIKKHIRNKHNLLVL